MARIATIGNYYSLVKNGSGTIIGGWINTDDSFKVGGTLPSAPNISLNASGSASFEGPVGIGTSSPTSKLTVLDNQALSIDLTRTGGSPSLCQIANKGQKLVLSNNTNGIDFETQTNSESIPSPKVSITSVGDVGIGTDSPGAKLDVASNAFFRRDAGNNQYIELDCDSGGNFLRSHSADTSNKDLFIENTNSTQSIFFRTNGKNQVVVKDNGNVGIGSTNPSEKLEVAGDICIDRGTENDGSLLFGPRANGNFIFGGGTSNLLAVFYKRKRESTHRLNGSRRHRNRLARSKFRYRHEWCDRCASDLR